MSNIMPVASKSELAYDWIRDRIARHDFAPGHRLVLGTIASALGTSVVPVREAIRRLEAEGLVSFERNVGARVAVIDEAEYVATMQTLGLVEGAATALSAPSLSSRDLDRAAAVNDRLQGMLDDFDSHTFTLLNQQFHSVLFESCPNREILELVHRGWSRLSRIRESTFAFVPARARLSVDEHVEILELIRGGVDPLRIEIAAREHRWRTMDAYRAHRRPHRSTTPPMKEYA